MVPTNPQPWILVGSLASTICNCPCPSPDFTSPSVLRYYTKGEGPRSLDSVFLSTYPCFPQLTLCWVAPVWELGSTWQDGPKQEVENNSLITYLLQVFTPEKWVKTYFIVSATAVSASGLPPQYSGLERSARFFLPSCIFFTLSFLACSQTQKSSIQAKDLELRIPFLTLFKA